MGVVKGLINGIADPRYFFILALASLFLVLWKRESLASNTVGYGVLGALGAFFLFGTFDPNFRLIVTKPDNVPIVGSIFLKAPLEQPANPANTPNPSKAPWYFLGLQEMLVYFDPWLAGVVLPSL